MVIISTSAVEVIIHAVSPELILSKVSTNGAVGAGAAAGAAAAGAAAAGAAAAEVAGGDAAGAAASVAAGAAAGADCAETLEECAPKPSANASAASTPARRGAPDHLGLFTVESMRMRATPAAVMRCI